MNQNNAVTSESKARETVLAFIKALNDQDYKTAREYASDDMTFVGVMGTRNGADVYIKDMEHMKFGYSIKKVFVDGDDVCLFYDIDMSGVTIFSCGWYHVVDGKIKSINVVFDPRPLLEASKKK